MSLYPIATIATINIANDSAFHRLLFSNMIANMPNVALKPYNIKTACFWVYPFAISLWCKWPLSGLNTAFKDFPLIILLKIANIVSNIGKPSTINGATNTNTVYVLATPKIDITAKLNPRKFEPTSPTNVFAGLKLNGKSQLYHQLMLLLK